MTTKRHSPTITFAQFTSLVSALCVLCGLAFGQDFKQLHPGVEYAQIDHKLGVDPVKINLLRLDLKKVRLDVHHALDRAIGLETTSSIASRKGAVAAINAGFFRLDKSPFAGDNVGFLLIDNYLWSEPTMERSAVAFANRRKASLVDISRWSFAGYLRWKSKDHPGILRGFNRETKNNEVVAYTPVFGNATPANKTAWQTIVKKNRVVSVCTDQCEIPRDGFVLVGSGEGAVFLQGLKIGDRIRLVWDTNTGSGTRPQFRIEDAVAGVPQLIKDGKIDITWKEEKAGKAFVETRHPRTAVAKLKDGKFLMVTVDGRQPGVSVGMNLTELAEYLLGLGATDAINLDGGGSTTMFLDGKAVNTPSDKEGERKIGDSIVVTLRKNSGRRK